MSNFILKLLKNILILQQFLLYVHDISSHCEMVVAVLCCALVLLYRN